MLRSCAWPVKPDVGYQRISGETRREWHPCAAKHGARHPSSENLECGSFFLGFSQTQGLGRPPMRFDPSAANQTANIDLPVLRGAQTDETTRRGK